MISKTEIERMIRQFDGSPNVALASCSRAMRAMLKQIELHAKEKAGWKYILEQQDRELNHSLTVVGESYARAEAAEAKCEKLLYALEHVTELLVDTWNEPPQNSDPENLIAVIDARKLLPNPSM